MSAIYLSVNLDFILFQKICSITVLEDQLVDIFQVSKVKLIEDELVEKYKIDAVKSVKTSCPRCRKIQSESEHELCNRCSEVVNDLMKNKTLISR